MPDATVDEVDQLPAIPRARDAAETTSDTGLPSSSGTEAGGERHRFTLYPGEVTAAIAVWQPEGGGGTSKHYARRFRYTTDEGPQALKIVVPALDFLPPGTRVDVEEQPATGRVRVHRATPPPVKGMSWKRPDLRSAMIGLAIILVITLIVGVVGYVVGRSKQPSQPPAPPGVTIQPDGEPVPQGPQGPEGEEGQQDQQNQPGQPS